MSPSPAPESSPSSPHAPGAITTAATKTASVAERSSQMDRVLGLTPEKWAWVPAPPGHPIRTPLIISPERGLPLQAVAIPLGGVLAVKTINALDPLVSDSAHILLLLVAVLLVAAVAAATSLAVNIVARSVQYHRALSESGTNIRSLWQTHNRRQHRALVPAGDHHDFAVHLVGEDERVQLLEFKSERGALYSRVLSDRPLPADTYAAVELVAETAVVAEECENAAWEASYRANADDKLVAQQSHQEERQGQLEQQTRAQSLRAATGQSD